MRAGKNIWDVVEYTTREKGVTKRHIAKLRDSLFEQSHHGQVLAYLADGEAFDKASKMLALKVESISLMERLKMVEARYELADQEFWISIREDIELGENQGLSFDPASGAIYSVGSNDGCSSSYQKSMEGYKHVLEEALNNPLTAHRMSYDPMLPEWLRETAGVLVSKGLKPAIRTALEDGIKDPAYAQTLYSVGKGSGWPNWLVETLEVLASGNDVCG